MPPVIVPHPNTIRGPIELEHNALRDAREQQYIADKKALEDDFHADLATLRTNKENALVAAGLNPDGGTPSNYPEPVFLGKPTITGTAQVGQTLTANLPNIVEDDAVTYQWNRDGVPVGGATANTRVVPQADLGTRLTVTVTATNEAGSESKTSDPTVPVIAA